MAKNTRIQPNSWGPPRLVQLQYDVPAKKNYVLRKSSEIQSATETQVAQVLVMRQVVGCAGRKLNTKKLRIASSDSVENTKVGVALTAGLENNLWGVWCTERNTKFRPLTRV
jgi:hypothetical protein